MGFPPTQPYVRPSEPSECGTPHEGERLRDNGAFSFNCPPKLQIQPGHPTDASLGLKQPEEFRGGIGRHRKNELRTANLRHSGNIIPNPGRIQRRHGLQP